MPRITLTRNLRRHVDAPPAEVTGGTVHDCLSDYFDRYPAVRSYVLDDRGQVRKHVAVFVGSDLLVDRAAQTDAVSDDDEITIMQALSGG